MDRAELLGEFQGRVDSFEKFQGFIAKAQSQAGKFAAAVVDKVVKDNTEKSMEIVGEIIPLMADIETVIGELGNERQSALDNAKDSKFKLEELELRHMIGDLSDDAFEAEAAEYKAVAESTDKKVGEIDEELASFQGAIDRWVELGTQAGFIDSDGGASAPEPAPDPEPEPIEQEPIAAGEADLFDGGAEVEPEELEAFAADDNQGAHVSTQAASMTEDVSVVFDADDGGDDDGFEVGDLDILGDDEDLELETGEAEDPGEDKPRRAVLLYQEGTAEEQIYPFTGDVMSLGRGRDNDVQVKNDSKVSRYHCKLYRRGPNFYIEDNKSANGTLVNGELITERRLFGGEEVIIGETFFRFRILD